MSPLTPTPPNGLWRNVRSGKTRVGRWSYYPPSDRVTVRIKGCPVRHIYGDHPDLLSYGDWSYVRDPAKRRAAGVVGT